MKLDSVLGHDLQKKIITNAIKMKRVSPSYIFCGPEGVGKKLLAIEFAKILNCLKNSESDCECLSCKKIKKGIHPDVSVHEYNEERTIKIDNIREDIEQKVFLSPFEGKYKVFIIDDAERMNINAQNAFLKTLEEPPQFSVIILVTKSVDSLLQTIRSRCQIMNFKSIPIDVIEKKLKKIGLLEDVEIRIASRIAGGSLGRALNITKEAIERRKDYLKKLIKITPYEPSHISDLVDKLDLSSGKENLGDIEEFFYCLSIWLNDLLKFKTDQNVDFIVNMDMVSELKGFSSKKSTESIVKNIKVVEETWKNIFWYNANKRLALENMLLKICD